MGAKYCDECVCPCAYHRNYTDELHQIFAGYTLPVAVARSSSDGVAIRSVLPVLWMTSRFHTVGFMVRHVYA